ncbi:MAG: NAD(P)-dependent oxidoreductase [Mediterranea sp.]|jgi:GDP-L-fucose synthase|nr:NAD(P)-dependent oxidoreductase [Mediterranea sp.]
MKNILLTGGSGFIGRNIQESFLASRYQIDAPSSRELDVADEESVRQYFDTHRPDVVIHAAVKPTHRDAKDFNNLFYTNTRMFFNLERYVGSGYGRMLVIGSGAIYDNRHYRAKMREEEWTGHIPTDEHGFCKYVCAKTIERATDIYDLRVFGIFGKYENYAIRFISNAICKTLFDLPITIKQDRMFDYLDVDDLMPVLQWFVEATPRHQAYNVTPDHAISLLELARMVREIAGKPDLPIRVAREGMGLEYSGDNHRLRTENTNWSLTPIRESIERLYRWYATVKEGLNKEVLLTDK